MGSKRSSASSHSQRTGSSRSQATQSGRSRDSTSTDATTVNKATGRSSAYDGAFEQHMIDSYIYSEGYEHPGNRSTPEPENRSATFPQLADSRASLSPSLFADSHFRHFKRQNKTSSEGSVMRNVIPILQGTSSIPNEGNLRFTNLRSMTGDTTVQPQPDFYDGNAYTYSSTYHSGTGTLQLYAHHVTAPTTQEGLPEYHMTQMKAYALTSDRESFVQGATAFRNARDLAQRHRDTFIQNANSRCLAPASPTCYSRSTVRERHQCGRTCVFSSGEPVNNHYLRPSCQAHCERHIELSYRNAGRHRARAEISRPPTTPKVRPPLAASVPNCRHC